MRDEDFQAFIAEFGEAESRRTVPQAAMTAWTGKLPNQLLAYWRQEAWGGYGDGRFWLVNPEDYEDIVDEWLENSPLEQLDSFHVIARTAFGKLYLCGEKSGQSATIDCALNAIIAVPERLKAKTPDARDMSIRVFLGVDRDECDLEDENGKPLFAKALKKLGPLSENEVYGFEPALVAGGRMHVENLRKLQIDQHLTVLRQLAAPSMPFSGEEIERLLKA